MIDRERERVAVFERVAQCRARWSEGMDGSATRVMMRERAIGYLIEGVMRGYISVGGCRAALEGVMNWAQESAIARDRGDV